MEDFVFNVRQIGNYPEVTTAGQHDLLLLQVGGLGGVYSSITPTDLVSTALLTENPLKLAPTASIQWNGVSLSFNGTEFAFSANVNAPILKAGTVAATADVTVDGVSVATQPFVTAAVDALTFVSSFNGRIGDVLLETDDVLRAGAAPIWNPHFGGHVTVPTAWNSLANDDTAASTAFVQAAICNQLMSGHVVLSYNGRGGTVVPIADDITAALTVPGVYGLANTAPIGDTSKRIANTAFVDQSLAFFQTEIQDFLTTVAAQLDESFAPLDSPQFVGVPTGPTAAQTVNSGQLATTAFVKAAVTASTTGVSSFNTRTGAIVLTTGDVTTVGAALLAGPAFTGVPTAPTPAPGDNSTKLATTAYVQSAVASFNAGVVSFNTRTGAVVLTTADITSVGGAALASPAFSGTPTAPTAAAATNTTQLATTAFVTQAISALPAPVTSFNGRTGAVSFQGSDVSAVGGALLVSPSFTGTPLAPTAIPGTSSTQIASTAFVQAALSGVAAGVTTYNGRSGAVVSLASDITSVGGALLAGPVFTGVPSAPTANIGTNTTQLATTSFVQAALAAAPGGVSSFNGRTGAITLQGSDVSAVGGAMLSSPAFTGNPTAPTASPGDSDTSIATTAFVTGALAAAGGVISFNGRAGAVTLNVTDISSGGGAPIYALDTAPPAAPDNSLWVKSNSGEMYFRYNDGSSTQWMAIRQAQSGAAIGVVPRNYIINGAMMASQENGATAGTTNNYYPVDQFATNFVNGGAISAAQVASVTSTGSPNRVRITVTTADATVAAGDFSNFTQIIEGIRMADLMFGTANAKTFTLQFGVKAPAGTYCVSFLNSAITRVYVAEYVIVAGEANTDVVKSVTVPGETSGVWPKDNTIGMYVRWGLMVGSTYQLAAGSWSSSGVNGMGSPNQFNFMGTINNVFELFDVGLYQSAAAPAFVVPDYPSELALCKRYYEITTVSLQSPAASSMMVPCPFKVTKRATPTMTTFTAPSVLNASYTFGGIFTDVASVSVTATVAGGYATGWVFSANARL